MAAMAGGLLTSLLVSSAAVAQGVAVPSADRIAALEKAAAANTAAIAQAQSAGDNAWMLVSAALVLLMSGPGLALFYGGLVRKKNVLATMMQTFAMMAVITVLWACVGYSLAFGPGNVYIGGLHNVFLHGVGLAPNAAYAPTIPAADLHDLSADVCDHHAGTDYRRVCRAHEVFSDAGVYGAVGDCGLQPDGAYGLGRGRISKCDGRWDTVPGLRGRHGGARDERSQCADYRAVPR